MLKSVRLMVIGLAMIFGFACSHRKAEEASQLKADTPLVAAEGCGETVFCTMEFAPHVCQFSGQSFEGSNRCAALREARAYACAQKQAFSEDQVKCEAKKVVEEAATPPCEERTICTREYMPHVCRFAEQSFSGPNRCEALNQVRTYACEKGLAFVAKDVSCQASERKKTR